MGFRQLAKPDLALGEEQVCDLVLGVLVNALHCKLGALEVLVLTEELLQFLSRHSLIYNNTKNISSDVSRLHLVEVVVHILRFGHVAGHTHLHLVLALHLGQLSIFGRDLHALLLALHGGVVCAAPIVHLASLHTLGLPHVAALLLLDLLRLEGLQLLGLRVELRGQSLLLLLGAQNLHKSLFPDHLKLTMPQKYRITTTYLQSLLLVLQLALLSRNFHILPQRG